MLDSPELAKERVKRRVSEGGHNIPEDVIERRYGRGIENLFKIYLPICDNVMVLDNSDKSPMLVMKKSKGEETLIPESVTFSRILKWKKIK